MRPLRRCAAPRRAPPVHRRGSQATSAVESARAAGDQATTTESFTTITAPFDGLVTEKMVEPGNMASPGVPLLHWKTLAPSASRSA